MVVVVVCSLIIAVIGATVVVVVDGCSGYSDAAAVLVSMMWCLCCVGCSDRGGITCGWAVGLDRSGCLQDEAKADPRAITPEQRHVWKKALAIPGGVPGQRCSSSLRVASESKSTYPQ